VDLVGVEAAQELDEPLVDVVALALVPFMTTAPARLGAVLRAALAARPGASLSLCPPGTCGCTRSITVRWRRATGRHLSGRQRTEAPVAT